MSDSFKELKEKLDNHHNWPEDYTFKFVVPKDQIDELLEAQSPDVQARAAQYPGHICNPNIAKTKNN